MTVLTINAAIPNPYVSLNVLSGGLLQVDVNGVITDYNPFDYTGVQINGSSGNEIFNILATNLPTTITGNGTDTVTLGNTSNGVQGITSPVLVTDPPGGDFANVTVYDNPDTTARTATVSNTSITGLAPATISYAPQDLSSIFPRVRCGPASKLIPAEIRGAGLEGRDRMSASHWKAGRF